LATGLTSALAADPTGDWRVADGVANIRVAECNGSMWGAVAWEKIPGGRDKNNPDASKQNRPTLGMPILIDMKKKPASINGKAKSITPRTGNPIVPRSIGRFRPTRDSRLRARLSLRWRNLDPCRASDSLKPGQQHGQGRAEEHRRPAQDHGTGVRGTRARGTEDHWVRQPAPKPPGQKLATAGQPADQIGDICLLPDIARFAH